MKTEKTMEEVLDAIAPCSMFCLTCTGCKYGSISYHAKELLHFLDGHEEFLDKNLKKAYRHKLGEFQLFKKKLKKYAYPKCGGCRNERASGCCIKNCFILECTREHQVNFCAACDLFPCDKINTSIYKQSTIQKWLNGNKKIQEKGIVAYYEENKDIPHYIEYTKGKGNFKDV